MLNEKRTLEYIASFAAELRSHGIDIDATNAAYLLEELADEVQHLRAQVAELLPWALEIVACYWGEPLQREGFEGLKQANELGKRILSGEFGEVE